MRSARLFVSVLFFPSMLLFSACITQLPVTSTESQKTDLSISVLKLSPGSTAALATGEKITVSLSYSFSKPKTLLIWAKPVTKEKRGGYEPSGEIRAGRGELKRFVFLDKPGKIDYNKIDAKDIHGKPLYEDFYKVDYTYTFDPKKAHMKGDGIGSFVSNVRFSHPSPATLSVGTRVVVTMDYKLKSKYGVRLWVIPSSTSCATYESSSNFTRSGSTSRYFEIGCPAHIDSITITMDNLVGEVVYRKVIPVDYTYK
jgi:hypothetical protein